MKFNEFINDVKAKGGVDTDGYYGKQCMDLYNYYCNNVLGLQNVGASCAKEILNNSNIMNNVERIDNYLDFVPQKGDIAVGDIGNYGHVCICLGEGDKTYFKSLDQNWREQQLTEEKHNYLDMGKLTFLRPKNQSNIQEKSIEELADEVIAQKWGNGEERKNRLTAAGYDYNAVQNRVNQKLGATNKKTIDQLAQEVIQGKWGVGQDRKNRLTQAGYDYNAVQNRVNQILK